MDSARFTKVAIFATVSFAGGNSLPVKRRSRLDADGTDKSNK